MNPLSPNPAFDTSSKLNPQFAPRSGQIPTFTPPPPTAMYGSTSSPLPVTSAAGALDVNRYQSPNFPKPLPGTPGTFPQRLPPPPPTDNSLAPPSVSGFPVFQSPTSVAPPPTDSSQWNHKQGLVPPLQNGPVSSLSMPTTLYTSQVNGPASPLQNGFGSPIPPSSNPQQPPTVAENQTPSSKMPDLMAPPPSSMGPLSTPRQTNSSGVVNSPFMGYVASSSVPSGIYSSPSVYGNSNKSGSSGNLHPYMTQPPTFADPVHSANPSPLTTPGQSEPPSARSSCNPSPVPTQRYDFMEGQFPSNKPSPVNSVANFQSHGENVPQHGNLFPTSPGNIRPSIPPPTSSNITAPHAPPPSGSIHTQPPLSSPSYYSPQPPSGPPVSLQSNSSGPYAPPMSGSMGIGTSPRPRYPSQVGYQQMPPAGNTSLGYQPPPVPPSSSSYGGTPVTSQPPPAYYNKVPDGPVGGVPGYDPQLHSRMAGMSVNENWTKMWGHDNVNLLQDRNVLPSQPISPPRPALPVDKPICDPKVFRCTLTRIPDTQSLLQKSRLPFGILIHPFRDIENLVVIQGGGIVRCRTCRTYINPYVGFVDQRRWKCNLCYRVNDLPDEFLYDPVTRSYGDPSRRPEVCNATVEFTAPSEYMVRPPQPAVYLFVLDVSHAAVETGYLPVFCKALLQELDNLPGDARTQVGFITFDGSIHFYNVGEGLNQPHMFVVSDINDIFLPSPDSLLVNLRECKALIVDLLNDLPIRFAQNGDTDSALGAALQAAYKLIAATGGRITVVQGCLPNVGPGALKSREDPNLRAAKDVQNLGPASDFYKKLALDCSGQQVAVDLFTVSLQYADIATVGCISKYSAGSIHYYPGLHMVHGKSMLEKFDQDLRRYLTRKIGFEAVMRIRCTRGLAIHTFHGNFFVRSTDLLSLPNVNPDAGYAMQISIEDSLTDCKTTCFQAAVLYTSSAGDRRIRVHTLSLPVATVVSEVIAGADQQAVIGLLAKMAVDRSLTSSLSDARDALINAAIDLLVAYKNTLPSAPSSGALVASNSTSLMPLYVLALLKHVAFRVGISTKLDERVYAMEQMKSMPLTFLVTYIYPSLYPVHMLDEKNAIEENDHVVPQPPILQLSFEKIDRRGAYLLDTMEYLYLYVARGIGDQFCNSVLGVPSFSLIPEDMMKLPELETYESEMLRNFISWLRSNRPFHSPLIVIREDSKERHRFLQYLVDDRTESTFSYYEFVQHLKNTITK